MDTNASALLDTMHLETDIVTECSDIDECAEETHNCDASATCSNNVGGYDSSLSGLGHTGECYDIDKCLESSHNCDENAKSGDKIDSCECQCNADFIDDGAEGTCADIDECNDGSHTCDENVTCTNNDEAFTCACNAGWNTSGKGQAGTCHNVNASTHTQCINSHTSMHQLTHIWCRLKMF